MHVHLSCLALNFAGNTCEHFFSFFVGWQKISKFLLRNFIVAMVIDVCLKMSFKDEVSPRMEGLVFFYVKLIIKIFLTLSVLKSTFLLLLTLPNHNHLN